MTEAEKILAIMVYTVKHKLPCDVANSHILGELIICLN